MDLGAGRKDRNDVLDLGVGIRVLTRVGQKITKGDPLFQVSAKAGHFLKPDLYLSTLEWTTIPTSQAPWLMATNGC
jgi:thymidine phosphorylase